MATAVTWNGVSYNVPASGERNWSGATGVDGLLISLVNNGFQKTGGTFTLSADADLGASAGLKSIYYKSRGTVATTGVIRLANAEVISWRNAANDANMSLTVDSSNRLTYAGTVVLSSAGVTQVAAGGTALTSYTAGDLIYASGATTLSKLGIGTASYMLRTNAGATAPEWALIVNANVDAAAAIAYSKLNLTSSVVTGDISGQIAVAKGGTNLASYTIGDIVYASGATTLSKLGIGTAGQVLKTNSGATAPEWSSPSSSLSFPAELTSGTTLVIADGDYFRGNTSGGIFTTVLPTAVGNTGKVLVFEYSDTGFANAWTLDGNGAQTVAGAATTTLNTPGEVLELISDNSNWRRKSRYIPEAPTAYTPTGSWSTNTTYTGFWARSGAYLYVEVQIALAGAPTSALLTINLPAGVTIDTAKRASGTDADSVLGQATIRDNGVFVCESVVLYSSTTAVKVSSADDSAGGVALTPVSEVSPITFAASDEIHLSFKVPIVEWKEKLCTVKNQFPAR